MSDLVDPEVPLDLYHHAVKTLYPEVNDKVVGVLQAAMRVEALRHQEADDDGAT